MMTSGTVIAPRSMPASTTAILAVLPALLAARGVSDAVVGVGIASFFVGRLVFQTPVGIVADRVDLRLMIAFVAVLVGATALLGSLLILVNVAHIVAEADRINQAAFLLLMAILGGLILPLYTVANSLAFARARGQPAVRIATTLRW